MTQSRKSSRKTAAASRRQRSIAVAQKERHKRRLLYIIGGSVVVALIAVGILALANRDGTSSSSLPAVVAVAGPDNSIPRDGMTIGSPDAPVKLVEYGDYQCPFCAQFSTDTMPHLMAEYVATGQVQLTFVPFSFLGDESNRAAEAAACAADQGLFWEMHDGIYGNHAGENQGGYSDARLREIASFAGVEVASYDACMSDGTHQDQIAIWNTQAQTAGVSSTPSFTINNGAPFSYQSWESFSARIDEALGQ